MEQRTELGEDPFIQSYEADLVEKIRTYGEQHDGGKRFVHVRKRNSSNRDLKAMQGLVGNDKLYSISLRSGRRQVAEIGEEAESVVTNAESLAKAI